MSIEKVKSIFKKLGLLWTVDGKTFVGFDSTIKIVFSFNDESNNNDYLYIYYGNEKFLEGCYKISDLNAVKLVDIISNFFIFNKLNASVIREIKLEYLLEN